MNEGESDCQMCPTAIFDRCSDMNCCNNGQEGNKFQKDFRVQLWFKRYH